ncbi:dihydrodipicolinate synthase family protein [Sporolituus thermophilus]|uniref:4-hydroxy-tetrahydrodipicolinate synthase n=1 Tax=Sporolituus thermophilus DSM 23256 TaxID=1123285 RepID=A0A1G7LGZ5_9FIRM|nr:dihydrodipicolinate synthase family protein [Sporolituus thermophilus]SDF48745.1 4-hydroxy-tetrahydrodipicolinate synthase [Sporolituus thermophilus DSM 23256]
MELKGVYPAMVTALNPDETVDKEGMRRVVRYCLDAGVHGVVVLGSTGEFPAMTETMRQEAIEVTLDEVRGQVPVLIGCGDTSTQKTITQVRAAARTKADAVLVALPYYYPLDQAGVYRHYSLVADASELPVVVYNFPQMTKISIAPDTLAKLASHPNIIGVKDSAGDFVGMQRYLEVTAGSDFAVMSGNPALGLAAYLHGAKGGIYAGCSLVPKLCADVYKAFANGDLAEALRLQKIASLIPLMGGFGANAAVIKFGLSRLGICGPTVSAPLGLAGGPEIHDKILAWMRRLGLEV